MRSDLATPVRGALFFTVLVLLLFVRSSLFSGLGLWGTVLTQVLLFAGLPLLFASRFEQRPLRDVLRLRLLSLTGTVKSLFLGLLAWALAFLLGSLLQFLVLRVGGKLPELYQDLTAAPFFLALLVGGVLPAIGEELAFRGYLLGRLGHLGGRTAVILTGLLFGMMHMTTIRLLPLAVLGLIFAAAVHRSGSILPGVIMHFVNNGVVLALAFASPTALNIVTLNAEDPSATMLLSTLAGIILLAWAAWALASTFGPNDLTKPVTDPEPPSPEERLPLKVALVPLIPAVLIYLLYGVLGELGAVFGS